MLEVFGPYRRFLVFSAAFLALITFACGGHTPDKRARSLVKKMSVQVGGAARLHALKDVEYEYTYRKTKAGKEDVSLERYVFAGELSWAKYFKRENYIAPAPGQELVQGFDGKTTWMTLDGKLSSDQKALRMADFLRKTNYYWFVMFFKLEDPGMTYEYKGNKTRQGKEYELVKVGFQDGVGDVQDTYILYFNRATGLVDCFLFTVLDFGVKEPFLMEVKYEKIEGLLLPTYRRYTKSNWDGEVLSEDWTEEISKNVKFTSGLKRELFSAR